MSASAYQIGAYINLDGTHNFLYQSSSPKHGNTKVTAADYTGNTVAVRYHDDVVTVSLDAIIPLGESVPAAGQVIKLTGIVLPTYDATGIGGGTWKITGVTTDSSYFFAENVSIKTTNKGFQEFTLDAVHYLANNIPNSATTT